MKRKGVWGVRVASNLGVQRSRQEKPLSSIAGSKGCGARGHPGERAAQRNPCTSSSLIATTLELFIHFDNVSPFVQARDHPSAPFFA
eukprot:6158838-Amphidinium_carterae.1